MPHPVDINVGARVRAARISRGYSQTQLGTALGISFQQVQKYERGTNRISISRLWEIAQTLNVDITHFLDELSDKKIDGDMPSRTVRLAARIEEIENQDVKAQILNLIGAFGKKEAAA